VYALCLLLSLTSWVQVCKWQVYFLFVFLKYSKFPHVAQEQTPDLLTQSLDTPFALARTGLNINIADPRTHDAADDHLERAVVILWIGEDVDSEPSESLPTCHIMSAVSRAHFITLWACCIRAGSMDWLCSF
jgi:hypothetical protein